MRVVLIFFILLSFLYPNQQLNEVELNLYKNMSASDESETYDEEVSTEFKSSSSLALRVLEYKKEYYVGEVFPIIIYARTNELSDFDFDILNSELEDIEDIDMSDFGFDLDFEDEEKEVEEDDFDIDANIPEEPKAKYGDIYQLGKHRLMCGDSTKEDDIEKLINGNNIKIEIFILV